MEDLQRVEKLAKQIEHVESGSAKNRFLRKMYQYHTRASLDIDARNIRQKDARLYRNAEREHKRLKHNAERLQEQCPTLFTQRQIATFIGEVIIQNAITEKDLRKKEELVKEGVGYLVKIPENINVPQSVSDLAKADQPI